MREEEEKGFVLLSNRTEIVESREEVSRTSTRPGCRRSVDQFHTRHDVNRSSPSSPDLGPPVHQITSKLPPFYSALKN